MNNLEKLEVLNHLIKSKAERKVSFASNTETQYMASLDSESQLDDSLDIICKVLDTLEIDIENIKTCSEKGDFMFEINFQSFSIKYHNYNNYYECICYLPDTFALFYLCDLKNFRKKKNSFKREMCNALISLKNILSENKA